MNWIELVNETQVDEIKENSKNQPVIIFKHSTRCSISNMAKNRLEREQKGEQLQFYYLDLLRHRGVSNKISGDFNVHHESPQILVIRNGECIYEDSHNGINMQDILEQALAV